MNFIYVLMNICWVCAEREQIVSLNFQTPDESVMLNDGLFEDNGACGYVLKPEFMRSDGTEFGPDLPQPDDWAQILTIRVISGHMLPKDIDDSNSEILDPYVQVPGLT